MPKKTPPLGKFQIQEVYIGPAMATEMLAKPTVNRHVKEYLVNAYAEKMKAGLWDHNGEPIKLYADGGVAEGRHRLNAIVKTGMTLPFIVITGMVVEDFGTTGVGAVRTRADVLGAAYAGVRNPNVVANACFFLWLQDNGFLQGSWSQRPTHEELLETFGRHTPVEESCKLAITSARRLGLPAGLLGWLHYCFDAVDHDVAALFVAGLRDGTDLRATDPVHLLRQRLLNEKASRTKMVLRDRAILVVRAWNYTITGLSMRRLIIAKNLGGTPQFPAILGPRDAAALRRSEAA